MSKELFSIINEAITNNDGLLYMLDDSKFEEENTMKIISAKQLKEITEQFKKKEQINNWIIATLPVIEESLIKRAEAGSTFLNLNHENIKWLNDQAFRDELVNILVINGYNVKRITEGVIQITW